MRIPLDYYRILGLPIQATAEQLKQAHRDRTLQLPRREYSEASIAARKQLIDQAYSVLSDSESRQEYDERFLATTYEPDLNVEESLEALDDADSQSPTIEIQDQQLVGALLILQELGEYELVLRLGRPYLSSGTANLRDGRFGEPRIVLSDIVLTVALSCLELGREQWQQGQYENAAEALETGQELLIREGLFAGVRGEIQSDLYKLRPYRILELLALPDENDVDRQNGLRLLRDMLQERGGIDGAGNDQSGLSVDDFLRFIQQLRGYLTAAEQQELFEEEARRPSAVATYLAVYALLARGFAEQQPALVRRAKAMLLRLGSRQDVHLEQAVCALLLGQTEEASRVLEFSQEFEQLAFIRENSQGAPDLLPGLCLYSERWLQDEVFPHFRDLAKEQSSLKDYFANEEVQEYLEELPAETELQHEWSIAQSGFARRRESEDYEPNAFMAVNGYPGEEPFSSRFAARSSEGIGFASADGSGTATLTGSSNVVSMPAAERFSRVSSDGSSRETRSSRRSDSRRGNSSLKDRQRAGGNNGYPEFDTEDGRSRQGDRQPTRRRKSGLPIIVILAIAAVGLFGFLMTRSLRTLFSPTGVGAGEPLVVELDQPVVQFEETSGAALSGDMNPAIAQKALEAWFEAKKAAMGQNYATDKLSQILADPKLSEWQRSSEAAKQEKQSVEYEHTVKVDGVEVSPTDPNQATVTATVTEVRKYSQAGQPANTQTDRDMQVRYMFIRQNNQWRIKDWK